MSSSLREMLEPQVDFPVSLLNSRAMDEFQTTSVMYASSKDHPIQRTEVTLTSEKTFSHFETTDSLGSDTIADSSTTTLTTTKTRFRTVSPITSGVDLIPSTSGTGLASNALPSSTNAGIPSVAHPGSKILPAGAIAGIVVGTIILLALFVALACLFNRRRKQRREWENEESPEPPIRSFTVLNQPRIAELGPPAQYPVSPAADDSFVSASPSNPRLSTWTGVSSPSPKLAVAEKKSYTRAWQKPRVFHVGRSPAELPAGGVLEDVELAELRRNHAR